MDYRRTVLELVKLGMDFERAGLVAECTPEQLEELRSDEDFQRYVRASHAILERDLLKELATIREINAHCGNSTETRWMLERINPSKWGANRSVKVKGKHEDDGAFTFSVEFVGNDNAE